MSDIIHNIIFSPFFGIILSLVTYEIGKYLFGKTKSIFCNPLLIGIQYSFYYVLIFRLKLITKVEVLLNYL